MNKYRKAIIAVVGAVVAILHASGVEVAEDVSESIIALVTALLVYIVPND